MDTIQHNKTYISGIFISIFVLILSFLSSASITLSQENTTPTQAPSKTPEIIPTVEANIESTPEGVTTGHVGFTQKDLSVLTGNVQRPNGIVWFDDQLYTSCSGDWTLYRLDDTTGSTITFVFGIRNAFSIYAEETEQGFNLWVPDFDTNTLFRVNQNRAAPTVVTSQLNGPWGITQLSEDRFLVTNLLGDNILSVTRTGSTQVVADGLRAPAGIVVDREGGFGYVANSGSARRAIEWFEANEDTGSLTLKPLVSGLQNVSNLVFGADGHLYFAYALGNRGVVGRIDPEQCRDNGCTNEQVEVVVYTELSAPLAGLSLSPDMRLFIHTIYRPEIYWIQLARS